jgi:hypothetical protein
MQDSGSLSLTSAGLTIFNKITNLDTISSYQKIGAGNAVFTIFLNDTSIEYRNTSRFAENKYYTLLTGGQHGDMLLTLLEDTLESSLQNSFYFRFVNSVQGIDSVKLTMTKDFPLYFTASYMGGTSFKQIGTGVYKIIVENAKTKLILAGIDSVSFKENEQCCLIASTIRTSTRDSVVLRFLKIQI